MRIPSLMIIGLLFACSSKPGREVDAAVGGDASADADPGAPTCVITGPSAATVTAFDTPVTLMATATDPQDGNLSGASIVWSSTLQLAPLGTGTSLPTTLPVGLNMVTCTATDSSGKTGRSASIVVVSKSPFAKINHPGNGETRPANQAVPFVGTGRDLEDGTLTNGSLVWTSNIDQQIGTGTSFNKVLSVGTHTITLTATDSNGNADAASIVLVIQ